MSKETVLIVDDTPDNISVLYEMLKEKYRVLVATAGEKALEILEKDGSVDLVLLDIMMPGLNGYEVCSRIKANPCFAQVPVIFTSAIENCEQQRMVVEHGAVACISKPYRKDFVLQKVAELLIKPI
ncbi:MAG: response regulator [Spirochaetes bacterium]|jgi:putative two-component system response regulator|nr:response regulator [Spirochaetota bacterium]